jgi:serine/threonine protein kinase
MHRDVKLANILIHFPEFPYDLIPSKGANKVERKAAMDELLRNIDLTVRDRLQVKIADLGFARELNYEELSDTICGTPLVMAPEVLNGKRYNHKADVWSLGVVYFEMLAGFTPFTGRDKADLKKNLEKGSYGLPKSIKLSL